MKVKMSIFEIAFIIDDEEPIIVQKKLESIINLIKSVIGLNDSLNYKLSRNLLDSYEHLVQTIQAKCLEQNLVPLSTLTDNLDSFLQTCLNNPEIVHSTVFSRFLDDIDINDEKVKNFKDFLSTNQFILQSFQAAEMNIPNRQEISMDFELMKGSTLIWRFHITGNYNIEFSAYFKPYLGISISSIDNSSENDEQNKRKSEDTVTDDQSNQEQNYIESKFVESYFNTVENKVKIEDMKDCAAQNIDEITNSANHVLPFETPFSLATNALTSYLHHKTKCKTFKSFTNDYNISQCIKEIVLPHRVATLNNKDKQKTYLDGSYTADEDGLMRLVFDNSYSVLTGKVVEYNIQVAGEDVMKAAAAAAEDFNSVHSQRRSALYDRLINSKTVALQVSSTDRPASDVSEPLLFYPSPLKTPLANTPLSSQVDLHGLWREISFDPSPSLSPTPVSEGSAGNPYLNILASVPLAGPWITAMTTSRKDSALSDSSAAPSVSLNSPLAITGQQPSLLLMNELTASNDSDNDNEEDMVEQVYACNSEDDQPAVEDVLEFAELEAAGPSSVHSGQLSNSFAADRDITAAAAVSIRHLEDELSAMTQQRDTLVSICNMHQIQLRRNKEDQEVLSRLQSVVSMSEHRAATAEAKVQFLTTQLLRMQQRLETFSRERQTWLATRASVYEQLADVSSKYDHEVASNKQLKELMRAMEVDQQKLLERILQLEVSHAQTAAASTTWTRPVDKDRTVSLGEEEPTGDPEQAKRIIATLQTKVSTLKAEKKVLVTELRARRGSGNWT